MDILYRTLSFLSTYSWRADDDFVDRLNYWYTGMLLVASSIALQIRDAIGERIHCWVPAYFSDSHEKYARNYCWSLTRYWVAHLYPTSNPLPSHLLNNPLSTDPSDLSHGAQSVDLEQPTYFQWAPIVLFAEAVMFNIPCLAWKSLNGRAGLRISEVIAISKKAKQLHYDLRQRSMAIFVKHLETCLNFRREYRSGRAVRVKQWLARNVGLPCGLHYGNHLAASYLLCKLLHLANLALQLKIVTEFAGIRSYEQWITQFQHEHGQTWELPGFPTEILCHFFMVEPRTLKEHMIQCVIPNNLFNEHFFIILWFWYCTTIVITSLNFLYWLEFNYNSNRRTKFIKQYLQISGNLRESNSKYLHPFIVDFLRHDGAVILKLISVNADHLFTTELVAGLWRSYLVQQTSAMLNLQACASAPPDDVATNHVAPFMNIPVVHVQLATDGCHDDDVASAATAAHRQPPPTPKRRRHRHNRKNPLSRIKARRARPDSEQTGRSVLTRRKRTAAL